ncbi:hypothetical protein V8J88_20385 [Massilia sp. W12]|uniref:hypothetical protein n=1 Tax=Massilia sp. W12 TaxID=3126507 RepID=UPI0030D2E04F
MTNLFQELQQAGLADAPGEAVFAHEGVLDSAALRLKLGAWSVPLDGPGLTETDLARLQAAAHPAPFGWGEQTMFDKAVRDSWEIDAVEFDPGQQDLIKHHAMGLILVDHLVDLFSGTLCIRGKMAFDSSHLPSPLAYNKRGLLSCNADTA